MNNIFFSIKENIKIKKGYFALLLILAILSIVLGVFAAINISNGILTLDLENISYIQYLKAEIGFASLIFKLLFSLFLFFVIIYFCNLKTFLLPISILFYMYFIYSQFVVLISLILVYGFFNCIILAILLFLYIILCCFLFLLLCLDLSKHCNCHNYFQLTFNNKSSNVLFYLLSLICLTLIFCIVLTILKSFVILLVY